MIHLLEPKILKKWIKNNEVILIDVREKSEYEESNINGSTLIPIGALTIEKVEKLQNENKDKKIAIHCRSGARSLRACQMLMEYNNELDVYNVEGGIMAFKSKEDEIAENSTGSCSTKSGGCSAGGCGTK